MGDLYVVPCLYINESTRSTSHISKYCFLNHRMSQFVLVLEMGYVLYPILWLRERFNKELDDKIDIFLFSPSVLGKIYFSLRSKNIGLKVGPRFTPVLACYPLRPSSFCRDKIVSLDRYVENIETPASNITCFHLNHASWPSSPSSK